MSKQGPIFLAIAAIGAVALTATKAQASIPAEPFAGESSNALTATANDIYTLALTMYGEASDQGALGMQAVANVVINRARDPGRRWPRTIAAVCRQPLQFSCWNGGDANYARMMAASPAEPAFQLALELATRAVAGELADVTGGANHYYNPAKANPRWAPQMQVASVIGAHRFLIG